MAYRYHVKNNQPSKKNHEMKAKMNILIQHFVVSKFLLICLLAHVPALRAGITFTFKNVTVHNAFST